MSNKKVKSKNLKIYEPYEENVTTLSSYTLTVSVFRDEKVFKVEVQANEGSVFIGYLLEDKDK